MNIRVHSQVQTAATLCQNQVELVIPCYQRPYVWPSEDVVSFLDQVIDACASDEPHYYIGTVLTSHVVSRSGSDAAITYELIDGQQRMTTLMVLALAFVECLPSTPLKALTILGARPRLTFNIREEVQDQLSVWAGLRAAGERDKAAEVTPYLKHLCAARKAALDRLQKLLREKGQANFAEVGNFLFHRVKWVNNVMPRGMDLNKLFATLNTSGLQLEQTDILKARLMDRIVHHRASYEGIWQACENMGNYFERNLREVFKDADWRKLKFADLVTYSREKFTLERPVGGRGAGRTIGEIRAHRPMEDENLPGKQEDDGERYQSIISFGLLLMHAYRIYRHQCGETDILERLNDNRLNACFQSFVDTASAAQAKGFIECLWQVRYQFDRWVVKWVRLAEEDERLLRLASVNNRTNGKLGYSRDFYPEATELGQLQCVRYFTGERSAQYWLTPFLGALIASPVLNEKQVLALLECIDNQLSISEITQKQASFCLLSREIDCLGKISTKLGYLKGAFGTGFEHYWFQKLEYILWRERNALSWLKQEKLHNYRVSSKNSVEHVHPQNEEFKSQLPEEQLHSFGNLVLLSPGENSSYSNLAVIKKQAAFRAKPKYDSLKLAHMFHILGKGDEWGQEQIETHQREMLKLIEAHYER
ncbi:DUF262 domain-containing protein [Pseudomonas sp. MAHUQ-62]|uniref:DUF262 domain-containing protein n=1 Tax=Pseudomonas sp. GCM10023245 TaxID=3252652 RepID=UPI0036090B8C